MDGTKTEWAEYFQMQKRCMQSFVRCLKMFDIKKNELEQDEWHYLIDDIKGQCLENYGFLSTAWDE
tara:strand:+ start:301 stop:498 length:198 start_codon:yes stop_codon:yes gene_type:complete